MHSIDNVDYSYLFEINNTTTRGYKLKLKKQFCKTNCRKYSFSQRVINHLNSLPQSVVQISNLNTFKTEIDKIFAIYIYTIYNKRIRKITHYRYGGECAINKIQHKIIFERATISSYA